MYIVHLVYVIRFVALSFLSSSRGGLRVLPPSIVTRFVARDPVSFECWFAWLHQSRGIILSSYISLHTEVTSARHKHLWPGIKIANSVQEWWEIVSKAAPHRSSYLALFIICYEEVGCKIMKRDTFNAYDCLDGKQYQKWANIV